MNSMGLDMSTNTGVSIVSCVKNEISILHAEKVRVPSGLTGMRRAGAIAKRVMDIMEEYKPDTIVMEGYALHFIGAAIVQIEIASIVKYFLYQSGYETIHQPKPSVLKKFCTGNGAAKKDTIIKEVYKRWGFDTDSNDIADSVVAAIFGCALEGGYDNLPKKNLEAVTDFTTVKVRKTKPKQTTI